MYGGVPDALARGNTGLNAVWVGSGQVTDELVEELHGQGIRVFAELNTMHVASYIEEHPDAAPVGVDGQACPPPSGWQGVSPTHEGYRRFRMDAFRELLADHEVDGVWLDYHHAHASWERAVPDMPDTGFDPRSLALFQEQTGIELPDRPTPELARLLLGEHREPWAQWRCDVYTDWVREFREILDAVRPKALLGTFHCPFSDEDYDGALRSKLHIDLRAQSKYLDVLSPMPYHARFGHHEDREWIARQVAWLGRHMELTGQPGERPMIWPIVQLADWGETVSVGEVSEVLELATRPPATGVTIFSWGGLREHEDRQQAIFDFYRAIAP
jgi:hypothetical protein